MRLQTFLDGFNFEQLLLEAFFDAMHIFGSVEPWPPLVTGLPGLHDNAASADACR